MTITESQQFCTLLTMLDAKTLTAAFFKERDNLRHAIDERDDDWCEASSIRLHAIEVRWFLEFGYWPDPEPIWHTVAL